MFRKITHTNNGDNMSKLNKIHSMINFSDLSKDKICNWHDSSNIRTSANANREENIRNIQKNI